MADRENHDSLITEFCGLTGSSPHDARQFLEANRWDLSSAAAEYFTALEEGTAEAQDGAENDPQQTEAYTGPRTLDGRPAPASAIPTVPSSSRSSRQPPRGGFATIDSMNQASAGAHAGHGHGHDDDDDDDEDYVDEEDDEKPRDLFAGGEKSGLAVQDPRRNDPRSLVNDIIKKAKSNASRTGGEPSSAPVSRFRGSGQTLGGDDTPSQLIPDPSASSARPAELPTQRRVLHLWNDGFSIEDGPLHRFDDPRNQADLAVIRSGRAPVHLMNVAQDQPVDVQLDKHDENYRPPPKVYKPFSGSGNRLGSPTPSSLARAPPPPVPATSTATESTSEVVVDATQPTLTLRIQLGNGTRLPARFNTTHTVGEVYDFISRASPDSSMRPWVLSTTFPNKDHTDKSAVLGELPEFKKGGTAMQKWV